MTVALRFGFLPNKPLNICRHPQPQGIVWGGGAGVKVRVARNPASRRALVVHSRRTWSKRMTATTDRRASHDAEFEAKLWSAIESDRTVMLGLAEHGQDGRGHGDVHEGHARPMTAQVEDTAGAPRGPIWFFTATDNALAAAVGTGQAPAFAHFASKGHDLFACIHGTLSIDNNPQVIDRLWNAYVAAWYEGGKTDPKLVLLRFDPDHAEVWKDASSVVAGVKMFLGIGDPKQDYRDKKASIPLH